MNFLDYKDYEIIQALWDLRSKRTEILKHDKDWDTILKAWIQASDETLKKMHVKSALFDFNLRLDSMT